MTFPANPTATSAVVGDRLRLVSGPGAAALLKGLTMPAVVVAFATYLVVGIVTMRVPDGTVFPGPRFFPAIIAVGLYAFAAMLVASAVAEMRERATAPARPSVTADDDDARPGVTADDDDARPVRVDVRSLAWVVVSFFAFAFLLDILGWIIAAGLLFWCVARGFGSRKPVASLVVGLTLSSVAYIGFDMLLGMPLPSGILGGF